MQGGSEVPKPALLELIGSGQLSFESIERIEARVVRTAAKVISISDGITENFRRRYPDIDHAHFVTINHGYDPDDDVACQRLFDAAKRTDRVLSDEECHRLLSA